MIKPVIQFLNAKLLLTGYFQKIYELSELIEKDGKTAPRAYCSNGEFTNLTNFDYSNGQSYWRKNGDVSLSYSDIDKTAGTPDILFKLPLKLVCFIPKSKLEDDAYTDDRVAQTLIKQLSSQVNPLRSLTGAKRVSIIPGKYITDNKSVLGSEYKGYDLDIRYTNSYLSLDFEVELTINKDCISDSCDIDSDILHIFNFCDPAVMARLTPTQLECLTEVLNTPILLRNTNNTFTTSLTELDSPYTLADTVVTQSNGTIENVPYNEEVTCQPHLGSAIHNSDNSFIETLTDGEVFSLPDIQVTQGDLTITTSPSNKNITCAPFVPVLINNSAGVLKYTKASGTTQNIPKYSVFKSNGSTLVIQKEFDENYTTPAVTITTSEGGTVTKEAGEAYTCTPALSRIYAYTVPTGATISYATRDDAWVQQNYLNALPTSGKLVSLASYYILRENNIFGNTNRFTDSLGAQLYGVGNAAILNYRVDNYTGYAWYGTVSATTIFDTALTNSIAFSHGGFSDYFVPNPLQLKSITNSSGANVFNHAPFNITVGVAWTSQTMRSTTTRAYIINSDGRVDDFGKTNTVVSIYCRKHF